MKRVTILVGPGGETAETTTEGFTGQECQRASAPFEKVLGKIISDEPTAEMFAGPAQQQVHQH